MKNQNLSKFRSSRRVKRQTESTWISIPESDVFLSIRRKRTGKSPGMGRQSDPLIRSNWPLKYVKQLEYNFRLCDNFGRRFSQIVFQRFQKRNEQNNTCDDAFRCGADRFSLSCYQGSRIASSDPRFIQKNYIMNAQQIILKHSWHLKQIFLRKFTFLHDTRLDDVSVVHANRGNETDGRECYHRKPERRLDRALM